MLGPSLKQVRKQLETSYAMPEADESQAGYRLHKRTPEGITMSRDREMVRQACGVRARMQRRHESDTT